MSFGFNEIAPGLVPRLQVEFDGSLAAGQPSSQPFRCLLIGQKTSAGTQAALDPFVASSAAQVAERAGQGSIAHAMAEHYFLNALRPLEVTCILQEDDVGGAKATGVVPFTGTATENGSADLLIGDKSVRVAIAVGDTGATLGARFAAAVTATFGIQVDAVDAAGSVTLTAKNAGEAGNQIGVYLNYFTGQRLPAGVTVGVPTNRTLSGGTGNPDISAIWAAIGSQQYNVIAMPFTDAANLTALDTELGIRWSAANDQNDGVAITVLRLASADNLAAGLAFASGKNSPHILTFVNPDSPTTPWGTAARLAAMVGFLGQISSSTNFLNKQVVGTLPPRNPLTSDFTNEEREQLLAAGLGTLSYRNGNTYIQRPVTHYTETAGGATDRSLSELNSRLNLSYIRWDLRNNVLPQFDGARIRDDLAGPVYGTETTTPKAIQSALGSAADRWEQEAVLESAEELRKGTQVVRNEADPTRVDILLSPFDEVNPLYRLAVLLQFQN